MTTTVSLRLRWFVTAALPIAVSIAASVNLGAQDSLTLAQAIEKAQRQSYPAHAARSALVAARAADRGYGATLLPQLMLGGTTPSYNRLITPVTQPDGTQLFTPLTTTSSQLSA